VFGVAITLLCVRVYACTYTRYVICARAERARTCATCRLYCVIAYCVMNGVVANNAGVSSNERTMLCPREMLREMCATRATLSKELCR